MPTTTIPSVQLNDEQTIPQLGLGVYQVSPEDTKEVVLQALEIGYRHIDTAQMYQNEQGVGEAIAESGIPREEIFVTSKLNNGFHQPDDARKSFADTLQKLGTDYVDLFLIHWPLPTRYNGDFVSTWHTLESFQQAGQAKSIGVSNFQVEHLERLVAEASVLPSVNQIELHPYFSNHYVKQFGEEHGIATEAWSPIAQGEVLDDPVVIAIADEIGKTPAQVVLRWQIEHGNIIFPKSSNVERMKENFEIFDFALSQEHIQQIDGLDKGEDGRRGPDPNTFDMIPE